MKTIITLLLFISTAMASRAVGLVSFANFPTTLISTEGLAMPNQSVQQFIFALFLAPSNTVSSVGLGVDPFEASFQLASGYTTNHPIGPGRIVSRITIDVGTVAGFEQGEFVDFVVRGWSANLGLTWETARNSLLSDQVAVDDGLPRYYGASLVGNDLLLGGGPLPIPTVFGVASYSVPGFDLKLVPEPSSTVLVGLGVLLMNFSARRNQR
jgi:hypothetical protein